VLKPGYRHYNQLVDICFWTLVGFFCWFIIQDLGLIPKTLLGQWHPLNVAALVIAGLFKLAMLALVLFSRLRDEYAERLWRQAAGTYAKFMVLMPFLWMLLMVLDDSWWHVTDWLRSQPDASPSDLVSPVPIRSASSSWKGSTIFCPRWPGIFR
jgi:hypothetical protein